MSEKIVEKDSATKVARKRLSVLEMAETLGNLWTHVVSLRREDAERLGWLTKNSDRENGGGE